MEIELNKISMKNQVECQADEIWSVLGKAWALLILKKLTEKETARFNELKKAIPEISNTVLSDRLHEFEKEGLITKKIHAEIPVRVEYSLTKQAKDLGKILEQLDKWVIRRREESSKKKRV
jgi:DNA-binding HxlR family transcriptional regulator